MRSIIKIIIGIIAAILFVLLATILFFPTQKEVLPLNIPVVWFVQDNTFTDAFFVKGDVISAQGVVENVNSKATMLIEVRTADGIIVNGTRQVFDIEPSNEPQEFAYSVNSIALQTGPYVVYSEVRTQDEQDFFITPFVIEPYTELTIVGPFFGQFDNYNFKQTTNEYSVGSRVDIYLEIYGFEDSLKPNTAISVIVSDSTGKIVDSALLEYYNETYSSPIEYLTHNSGYDTSKLTPGTYYMKFIAQDTNNQVEKYAKVVLK